MLDASRKSLLHRTVDVYVPSIDRHIVQFILTHQGLVKNADKDKMTCLHYTVLRSRPDVARNLLDAGFNVDTKIIRLTPLQSARQLQHEGNIESRANDNTRGLTSLYAAPCFGWLSMVKLLLDRQANVNARTGNGQTPIHLVLSTHLRGSRFDDIWAESVYRSMIFHTSLMKLKIKFVTWPKKHKKSSDQSFTCYASIW
jgi:ankyrin repeat protein